MVCKSQKAKNIESSIPQLDWDGVSAHAVKWVQEKQLKDRELWKLFVNQFRIHSDAHGEWRGEFWGKMMRGAVMVFQCTADEELFSILTGSVQELLTVQNSDGSFSSYPPSAEFTAWDMWCRKYVMLGLEYYLEICEDETFFQEILTALCAHADAILEKVGSPIEGKKSILETSIIYGGMNSASIFEPMVRLYRLTNQQKYLEFAKHILDSGGSSLADVFHLAYEDQIDPYLYGVNKAYEMMSCFEGLIEYYEVTGDRFCLDASLRFARRVISSDVTVIGCCGTETEFFDHSAVRQTRQVTKALQETCVSVTWMKLCRRLFLHTGDASFLDEIEKTYYNAFLGSLNTEDRRSADRVNQGAGTRRFLAFDSYSPLTFGHRGILTGGAQPLEDGTAYGCCAAIGAAGTTLLQKSAVLANSDTVMIGMYESGTISLNLHEEVSLRIKTKTAYPADGKICMSIELSDTSEFSLFLRIPAWSRESTAFVNGIQRKPSQAGWFELHRFWQTGDCVELNLDMSVYLRYAPWYEESTFYKIDWNDYRMSPITVQQKAEDRNRVCFQRGPLMLAATERLGWSDCDEKIIFEQDGEKVASFAVDSTEIPYNCLVSCDILLKNNQKVRMTDYGSSGKLWSRSDRIAVWLSVRFIKYKNIRENKSANLKGQERVL